VIAVVIIGIVFFIISYGNLISKSDESQSNVLSSTINSVETKLLDIDNMTLNKSLDYTISKSTLEPIDRTMLLSKDIVSKLNEIENVSDIVQSAYLYYGDKNFYVTSNEGVFKGTEFYDNSWKFNMHAPKDLVGKTWTSPRNIITLDKTSNEVISLIRPIFAVQSMSVYQNVLIVNIYEDRLLPKAEADSFTVIIDESGKIISHSDNKLLFKNNGADYANNLLRPEGKRTELKINGVSYYCYSRQSSYNNWTYVSIIPKSLIQKQVLFLGLYIFIACTVLSVICGIVAYHFTHRVYSPFVNFVKSLYKFNSHFEKANEADEFKFLEELYKNILRKNNELESAFKRSIPALRRSTLIKLLEGEMEDIQCIQELFEASNLKFSGNEFVVFLIVLNHEKVEYNILNEKNLIYYELITATEKIFSMVGEAYSVVVKNGEIAVVVCIEDSIDRATLNESLMQCSTEMINLAENCFKIAVWIAKSNVYSDLQNITQSYMDAVQLLKYRFYYDEEYLITDEKMSGFSSHRASDAVKEENTLQQIKEGNADKALDQLHMIIQNLKSNPTKNIESVKQLFYRLLEGIIDILYDKNFLISDVLHGREDIFESLGSKSTLKELGTEMEELIYNCCSYFAVKKEGKNSQLIRNVIKYLENNCHKGISLEMVAKQVFLTASHLSRVFKEETGKNFIEYLSELRVSKAKEILKNPKYTISEISEKLCFGNVQGFIRTFKKYEGETPGQFRQRLIETNFEN